MNFIKNWLCRDELAQIEELKESNTILRSANADYVYQSNARHRLIDALKKKQQDTDELLETSNESLRKTLLDIQKFRNDLQGARSELEKAKAQAKTANPKRKNLRARAK